MNMIRGTVNGQRHSSHFTDNPAELRKQAPLKFIIHQRTALFRAENDMRKKLGKGVRHEEISRGRVKGEIILQRRNFKRNHFVCHAGSFLSPAAAGSGHFRTATPPSSSRKAGRTQTGLKLCQPFGPLIGNEPGILRVKIWGALGVALVAIRRGGFFVANSPGTVRRICVQSQFHACRTQMPQVNQKGGFTVATNPWCKTNFGFQA
jgi:hypothetical protein